MTEETRRIVEWLRGRADDLAALAGNYGKREIYHVAADYQRGVATFRELADSIERGHHLKDKSE